MENDKRSKWYLNTPGKQELILVGSFMILYVLSTMVLNFRFNVSFWISEMNERYTVEFKASDISQLIFLNLVWPYIAWWAYRDCKKAVLETNPEFVHRRIWDFLFFVLIFFFIMSNTSHVIVNRINGKFLDQDYIKEVLLVDSEHGMSAGYLLIYFYDEYLGHIGMMAPLFFAQVILFRLQLKIKQNIKEMNIQDLIILSVVALGAGVYNSYSLIEGQANIPLLILHLLLIPWILWLLLSKKHKFIENPMFLFLLLQVVGFLIYSIVWIAQTGLKSYYPFTYQPSELEKPWF